MLLCGIKPAQFLRQSRSFDAHAHWQLALDRPAFEQPQRFLAAPLLHQEHRQPSVAISMICIVVEALIVVVFGLIQVLLPFTQLAQSVVRRGQVIVAIRVCEIITIDC